MKLLNNKELQKSPVVANCFMNRERNAFGDNSYVKEIYIDPELFLKNRAEHEEKVIWLDICCGTGRALIQVMKKLRKEKIEQKFLFIGTDLAGIFDSVPKEAENIKLIECSLDQFHTEIFFDLITCVHGMHYIGDKLGIIRKYIHSLKKDGVFICNIDTNNIFDKKGNKLGRKVNLILRNQGISYDSRKRLLKCKGRKKIILPFRYSGANDKYGKNYTGQKVVSSYYELLQSN